MIAERGPCAMVTYGPLIPIVPGSGSLPIPTSPGLPMTEPAKSARASMVADSRTPNMTEPAKAAVAVDVSEASAPSAVEPDHVDACGLVELARVPETGVMTSPAHEDVCG